MYDSDNLKTCEFKSMNILIVIGLAIILCIVVPSFMFLGMGYIFSSIFNLSLIEATAICIGSSVVCVFFLAFVFYFFVRTRDVILDEIMSEPSKGEQRKIKRKKSKSAGLIRFPKATE